MQRHAAVLLLAATALAAASCDDTEARLAINQPTPFHFQTSASFGASPSSVFAQPVDTFFCPSVAPFIVQLNLIVQAGAVNVFLTEVRLRFTDTFGAQMPQVTLPAPIMTTQFGSALVAARSARTFPLSLGLGCGTARSGTVVIFVDTRDDLGRIDSGQVSVGIR